MIGFRVSAFFQAYLFLLLGSRCPNTPYLLDRIASSRPNFVFKAEFRLRGRISSSGPNFVFAAEFRLQGRISSSPCPKPNFVFAGISSSWPIFVFKFRLRAQFELQLLGNNFVFKSFGISASGGVRNRDPLSRVNACTVRANLCCCISDKGYSSGIISAAISGCGAGI